MSSLRPEDRALFDAARVTLEPSEDDRARIGKALGIKAGIAAATTATAVATTTTAVAGLSTGIGVAKWIVIVSVVVAGAGGAGVALHRTRVTDSNSVAAAAREKYPVAIVTTAEAPKDNARRTGSAAPEAPSLEFVNAPIESNEGRGPSASGRSEAGSAAPRRVEAPAVSPPPPSPASTATLADAAPGPAPPEVSVAEEVSLLREADAALRSGDAVRAAKLLDDHARLFPHGVLAEERDAQRVLVLCAAGEKSTAREEAQRFLARYPESLLAERVRTSCTAP